MTDASIAAAVSQFVLHKDEVSAAEIAAFLITLAREEFGIDDATYEAAHIGKQLLWRGSTSSARDVIKNPKVVEAILDEAEGQGELFPGSSAFVRVGRDADGVWFFKRRHVLTREDYQGAMRLLRLVKGRLPCGEASRSLIAKIERYQAEYDKAAPYWSTGMTFGEAFRAAMYLRASGQPHAQERSVNERALLVAS